jgi:hypothetical protein
MGSNTDHQHIQPIAVRLRHACELVGLSKSELYRRAKLGQIEIVKAGTSSLVLVSSLHSLIASLPRKKSSSR